MVDKFIQRCLVENSGRDKSGPYLTGNKLQ